MSINGFLECSLLLFDDIAMARIEKSDEHQVFQFSPIFENFSINRLYFWEI